MQISVNGSKRELADSVTLAALLDQLSLNPQQLAVEVNRQLVPRSEHAECVLRDGDQLEIVTLVGGG